MSEKTRMGAEPYDLETEGGLSGEPQTEGAKTHRAERQPMSRAKRRAYAWVGGVAVVAVGAFAGYKVAQNQFEEKAIQKKLSYDKREAAYNEKARLKPIPEAASVFVLHSGTVYRDSPYAINDTSLLGISKTVGNGHVVPKGKEILVTKAIWKADENGTWVGFTFDNPDTLPAKEESVISVDVADKYYWVNYGALRDDHKKDGTAYIDAYPVADAPGTATTMMGRMDAAGYMIDNASGRQSAYGIEQTAGKTRKILDMFGLLSGSDVLGGAQTGTTK